MGDATNVRPRHAAVAKINANDDNAKGFGGAPTRVRLPSIRREQYYWLMSCCSADTVSRMKSNDPACLAISSVLVEMTTS